TTQYNYLDGSVGMSYNSNLNNNENNTFFLGAAYHHFNRPKQSFYRNSNIELNPKLVFSGGLKLAVSENAFLTLQADQSMQGGFSETVAGTLCGLKIGSDFDD